MKTARHRKPLTFENDARECVVGSALLQGGKPIAFASRTLSESERQYEQIEKEMLAVTYGLEKFHLVDREVNAGVSTYFSMMEPLCLHLIISDV